MKNKIIFCIAWILILINMNYIMLDCYSKYIYEYEINVVEIENKNE